MKKGKGFGDGDACSIGPSSGNQASTPLDTFTWPQGPITRSKAKMLKTKLQGLVQSFVTQEFGEEETLPSARKAGNVWFTMCCIKAVKDT